MKILLLIGLAIACFWAARLLGNKKGTKPQNQSSFNSPSLNSKHPIELLNREGDMQQDEWHTYIAGISYHTSENDIGGFSGCVANDFNNKYDSNAMAVYSGNKLLGYIPAKELADYREWSDCKVMPCIGVIYVEDGQIRGRVKILRPCNLQFLQQGFGAYINWIDKNWGSKYLPKNIQWDFDKDSVANDS